MTETRNQTSEVTTAQAPVRKTRTVVPLVDIYENRDEILLQVEMPGVSKDDIRIDLDNGRLSLTGMRQEANNPSPLYSEFGAVEYQRTFSVPQSIDGGKVKAELHEGVLNLHLPKSEAHKPRTIEIKAG